jgi:ribosomal protein S18 acetylase RimI-like enzyme
MREATALALDNSVTLVEEHRGEYSVSTDASRMNLSVIHGYLTKAYWSEGVPRHTIERAMRNSLCFGVFKGDRQIGFARVVTDYATYAYICDVFVLEAHRGRGLATWLLECISSHPDLQGLRRWGLTTRDAHPLYEKAGFERTRIPERYMDRVFPDIYKSHKPESHRVGTRTKS